MWKQMGGALVAGGRIVLQLSHIHMNVETRRVQSLIRASSYQLQLSHIHMNVETKKSLKNSKPSLTSFN